MSEIVTIPHIKANSNVPVIFDISQINGLYGIYQLLINGFNKEQIEAIKIKIESRQPLLAPEMGIITISKILNLIHQSAKDNDMIEYLPLDKALKDIIPQE